MTAASILPASPASPSGAVQRDASAPDEDGKCRPGAAPFHFVPGCGAAAKPICWPEDDRNACQGWHCGCDGVSFMDVCNQTSKPYQFFGRCEDTVDTGPVDAGTAGWGNAGWMGVTGDAGP